MSERILCGGVLEQLKTLPDESVHCVATSPPYYGLRDYGVEGQIGLEKTPELYVQRLVEVFREIKRVLHPSGVVWLNLGDSYAANRGYQVPDNKHTDVGNNHGSEVPIGLKPKDLIGIPWRVAFALQEDDWWLRSDIIWHKPNVMPSSVRDRCTTSHEYIFMLTKRRRYYYDNEAIKVPAKNGDSNPPRGSRSAKTLNAGLRKQDAIGKNNYTGFNDRYEPLQMVNRRDVWTVTTKPYCEAHFATWPEELVEPMILAGSSERGCCPKCLSPWERVVKRLISHEKPDQEQLKRDAESKGLPASAGRTRTALDTVDPEHKNPGYRTIGWRPTCGCSKHSPIPCTILDPFCGSGTTLAVAKRLGRDSIGIELNPDYVKLAEKRIAEIQLPAPTLFPLK